MRLHAAIVSLLAVATTVAAVNVPDLAAAGDALDYNQAETNEGPLDKRSAPTPVRRDVKHDDPTDPNHSHTPVATPVAQGQEASADHNDSDDQIGVRAVAVVARHEGHADGDEHAASTMPTTMPGMNMSMSMPTTAVAKAGAAGGLGIKSVLVTAMGTSVALVMCMMTLY